MRTLTVRYGAALGRWSWPQPEPSEAAMYERIRLTLHLHARTRRPIYLPASLLAFVRPGLTGVN